MLANRQAEHLSFPLDARSTGASKSSSAAMAANFVARPGLESAVSAVLAAKSPWAPQD